MRSIDVIGLTICLGLALLLPGCGGSADAAREKPTVEVIVDEPVQRPIRDYLYFNGNVHPVEQVDVRARVSGYVVKADFIEGQMIEPGHELFSIDPEPYQIALGAADAERARWQATLEKAQATLARDQKLKPSGAITQEELDQSIAETKVMAANVQQSDQAIESAKLDLRFCEVKAPIAGRVSRKNVTRGNLISIVDGESGVLTSIVSMNPIYVHFYVDENQLQAARQMVKDAGMDTRPEKIADAQIQVEIALAQNTEYSHSGILDFVDNKLDPTTGKILARAVFQNDDNSLMPGYFTRVRVAIRPEPRQAMLIEETAVGTDQGIKFVYIVDADNKVERRRVTLGNTEGEYREVLQSNSELKVGERVIVEGSLRVRPGDKVVPKQRAQPAAESTESN